MNELQTKPQIFNVHYQIYKEELTPAIFYISTVSVKDTVALKKENDELHKSICHLFAGMDKNNIYMLERAYNVMPDGKNDPAYFGFIQKTQ